MNPILFDEEKDHQLNQLLKQDSEASDILRQLLFCSELELPERLSLVT